MEPILNEEGIKVYISNFAQRIMLGMSLVVYIRVAEIITWRQGRNVIMLRQFSDYELASTTEKLSHCFLLISKWFDEAGLGPLIMEEMANLFIVGHFLLVYYFKHSQTHKLSLYLFPLVFCRWAGIVGRGGSVGMEFFLSISSSFLSQQSVSQRNTNSRCFNCLWVLRRE